MRIRRVTLVAVGALLGPFVLPLAATCAAEAIVVSAAASLRNAFEEIGALLPSSAARPGPSFTFGASGELLAQIRGGAPIDVFAAAAARDMDLLESEAALLPGTRVAFAANSIVLIVPSAAVAAVCSFKDLARPEVVRIAVCNPRTSPAGRYSEEVFSSAGISDSVRTKLVFAENVRQVLDYVARGEVDAGVVYATDAGTRPLEVRVAARAPVGSHKPVIYPIAVLSGSTQPEAAKAFLAAVQSDSGQAILARFGFRPVPIAR